MSARVSFARSAKVVEASLSSMAVSAASSSAPNTAWTLRPMGHSGLGCSCMWNTPVSSSTASSTSRSVISSGSMVRDAPPTPGSTATRPAALSWPRTLRTMTGFTPTLPARNVDVVLCSSPSRAMQSSMWVATGSLDENLMIPLFLLG